MQRPAIDFDRNDIDAALAAWDANEDLPDPDPDFTEALVMMFDDPGEFLSRLNARVKTRRAARRAASPAR